MNDRIREPEPVVGVQVQGIRLSPPEGIRLSPSEGYTNSIQVSINTIIDEIRVNPTTGHRRVTSKPVSYSLPINFSLSSCSHHDILSLLHDQLHREDHWFCDRLVPKISTTAINSGFGYNDIELKVHVTVTYQLELIDVMPVPPPSNTMTSSLNLLRMVLLGKMEADELKSLNMETESCSICLQSLVSSSKTPTRMSCFHVFHNSCLVEWFDRKNTCPLCRTVLYDR